MNPKNIWDFEGIPDRDEHNQCIIVVLETILAAGLEGKVPWLAALLRVDENYIQKILQQHREYLAAMTLPSSQYPAYQTFCYITCQNLSVHTKINKLRMEAKDTDDLCARAEEEGAKWFKNDASKYGFLASEETIQATMAGLLVQLNSTVLELDTKNLNSRFWYGAWEAFKTHEGEFLSTLRPTSAIRDQSNWAMGRQLITNFKDISDKSSLVYLPAAGQLGFLWPLTLTLVEQYDKQLKIERVQNLIRAVVHETFLDKYYHDPDFRVHWEIRTDNRLHSQAAVEWLVFTLKGKGKSYFLSQCNLMMLHNIPIDFPEGPGYLLGYYSVWSNMAWADWVNFQSK
uniref:Uncharacterized protein n=1 Tax=Downingia cuspidata TaxID=101772 RepID=A0A1Z2QT23_9ASTR|nr:hypothetical protein Do_cus1Pt0313 [Downingia cuspidata]ASA34598.1 hypothetical protein Do_cus1Pt0313 [Downingia cuspidata]